MGFLNSYADSTDLTRIPRIFLGDADPPRRTGTRRLNRFSQMGFLNSYADSTDLTRIFTDKSYQILPLRSLRPLRYNLKSPSFAFFATSAV